MSSNQIDPTGIQIQTYNDIINDLVNGSMNALGLKQIYGNTINVDSNSPDGQLINIFALSKQDILNLIVQDYNSKDPDQAIGVALDSVSQLCGIARQGGTYTQVSINVTVSQTVNLLGQDTSTPFTVSDGSGNLFQLIVSATLTVGTTAQTFQAVNIGAVQVLANTITTIVTPQLGVTSVTNPSTASQAGQNQETDAVFRVRRQKSVATPSQGFLASLLSGLQAVTGLTQVVIYENVTSSTDANGVGAHSIWVITKGGSNSDIANVIYKYRNAGCGMKGSVSVNVTQIDGTTFAVLFDTAVAQTLYAHFHLVSKSGGSIDNAAAKAAVVAGLNLGIYQAADITTIDSILHAYNPDLVVSSLGVSSDNASFVNSLLPTNKYNYWSLIVGNITIT